MRYNPSFSHHILNKSSKDRLNAVMVLYNAISDSISCVRKVDNISLMKNAILECMDEVTKDYIKRK